MNFALILLVLTVVTGLISLFDIVYFAHRRPHHWIEKTIEQARSFFPIFLIVLLLRSFLLEPFRIPSGSLEPTLRVGDFVVVNKFIYGIRLPVSEKKIINVSEPKRGDIAVFRWPLSPNYDYIKRVIGVPGDKIVYKNKILFINGVKAEQKFIAYTTDPSSGHVVAEYEETLGTLKHKIYIRPGAPINDYVVQVPVGSYFMMGDNRDDSSDSRFWGFVDKSYLRGSAFLIWMSWDSQTYAIRWSRLGKGIH